MIQGKWDFMIQQVSFMISSPFMPCICRMVSVCRQLSEPVGTPVIRERYFLKKEFPERGKDAKQTLLPMICSPSRKIPFKSNSDFFFAHHYSSFDFKKFMRSRSGIVWVSGFAIMCPSDSRV